MQKKCPVCGIIFERCPSKIQENTCCSRKCRGEYSKKQIKINCFNCGKETNIMPSKLKRNNNIFCCKECHLEFRKNNGTRKGCKISEETRQRMSISASGEKNSQYGKDFSAQHRERISKSNIGKHHYWAGKKQPKEMIDKRVEKLRIPCSEEKKKKISASNKGKKRTLEVREKNSIATSNRKCFYKGHFFSTKNNKEILYRSSYELKAFEILEQDKNVLKYEYEKLRIKYFYNEINRIYIPDLLVYYRNDIIKVIEIKAEWATKTERNLIKCNEAMKYCKKNNYLFEVWTEKELF